MTITYASQTGTDINSPLVSQTISTQTGGNNQVQLSSTTGVPSGATGYGSNVGDGTNGLGDTYVGRRVVLRPGTGTEQSLVVTAASGTSPTLLTVSRDWDTPPSSGDVVHVPYEFGDIEDGGAGGGINLNAKTGLYELSNLLNIKTAGSLEFRVGQALEGDDRGANINIAVESGGRFYGGFDGGGGAYVNGGINTNYNGANGEPSWQIQSGGRVDFYDMLFWAQLQGQQFENANGSDGRYYGCKWLSLTDELHLFDSVIRLCVAIGKGATTEIIRVDAGTDCDGLILSNVDTIETASGDTTTETIELSNVTFLAVTDLITLANNKTYNMVSPIWTATSHTDFNSAGVTGSAAINDLKYVGVTVQKADGTKVGSAKAYIYENTILDDVQSEITADGNGLTSGSFAQYAHSWTTGTGSTTSYGGHAFIAAPWLYTPFVAAQPSAEDKTGVVVVALDPYISETNITTATSAGSGVTINEDTNPSELVKFKLGSGTIAVGMILTFSGGAVGTVTELLSGDSTAGYFHLKTRNATAIGNDETFSRTGGTAGTFSGTYDNVKHAFTKYIDANSVSYQAQHDYYLALIGAATIGTDGKKIISWMRDQQAKILYSDGSKFYTERAYGKGVIVVNAGAGSVDHFTDDAGGTWSPPVSITTTLAANVSLLGAEIAIYDLDTTPPDFGTEISHIESNTGSTYQFSGNASNQIKIQVILSGYVEYLETWTIPSVDSTKTIDLDVETNQ